MTGGSGALSSVRHDQVELIGQKMAYADVNELDWNGKLQLRIEMD